MNSVRKRKCRRGVVWAGGFAIALSLILRPEIAAKAGQRKFLVILANSPKQFACLGGARNGTPCEVSATNACPGGTCSNVRPLPDPEAIQNQYFDIRNPSTGSFAEYWKEISYGDVTISGEVTDWVLLPWRIAPTVALPNDSRDLNRDGIISPADFPNLSGGGYSYGAGERFDNRFSMVSRNIGRPNDPNAGVGAKQVSSTGAPVFTPGERFLDVNGNGVWDGVDEATNSMDYGRPGAPLGAPFNYDSPDDRPDNLGPWIDLNGDGLAVNPPGCRYLQDSDNDGNPDCCPNGPTRPAFSTPQRSGCGGMGKDGKGANACPATQWQGPNNTTINDCNGNLIDDAIDIANGTSLDRLPFSGSPCVAGQGDGIPDECQYLNPDKDCAAPPLNCGDPPDVCCGPTHNTTCVLLPPAQARRTVPRCEYHDANGNGRLDIVEPFESFLHGVPFNRLDLIPSANNPLGMPGTDYDTYVTNNYPGSDPNTLISQKTVRQIGGPHDPLNKITDLSYRICADGDPYRTIGSQSNACPAGVHAEYRPPDKWFESRPPTAPPVDWSKMAYVANQFFPGAAEPTWYQQAWQDRYGTTQVPGWVDSVQRMVPVPLDNRPTFTPNRGGTNGRGSGWTANVDLTTVRILPDELNGVGQPVILYDGPVEFDDLPSSKYHMAGDQQFGEVTSPFNNNIYGDGNAAAGPYATRLYGQHGRPAGNVLNMEWLTWRTTPPFNTGAAWEATYGPHPYAGPAGGNFGFRDYNLDGMLDLGECRVPGSENYLSGFYPWNRDRLVEDTINILDEGFDFDEFVDPVTRDQLICVGGASGRWPLPEPYASDGSVAVAGACSGIVLLPNGLPQFSAVAPNFTPIHNEDGLNDSVYQSSVFPKAPRTPQFCWNILFHNLVLNLDSANEVGGTSTDFQTALAAHEYLHSWQDFPDLYDGDLLDGTGVENCPIGLWDIMAKGGLVHPSGPLKERPCTEWIQTVDLTTVLTPGVTKAITFPSAESIRDNSYYFLQNEDRLGEKYYFWSAGNGFDAQMPGKGLLILHADPNGSNPDAIALQQRIGIRPAYGIIQADGRNQLLSCINEGDAGDPWPGSTNNTEFDCSTLPASQWYTDDACTGLEILDVVPDGAGSTLVTFNWTPTNIPSLRFIDPPGGTSVGSVYQIRSEANDVFGGTWIRFYYTAINTQTPLPSVGTLISLVRKTVPATTELSVNWDLNGIADGRYFIFADLIPAQGADGPEAKLTTPRAGRNNAGSATLSPVNVDVSTIDGNGNVTHSGTARLETWTATCVDATAGKWVVSSSLTQPLPAGSLSAAMCDTQLPATCANRGRCATTGTLYKSCGGEVQFTIAQGLTGNSKKGALGDSFTFTTTGLTAPSAAVTITGGRVTEDPIAVIDASPLSGLPPLTVDFDARRSRDPNGQPLTYRWDFGDGSATQTGAEVQHTYTKAGTFTTVLRATNNANSRFGEAAVDIEVINNSPKAVIKADPSSGQAPLTVSFSAASSSDAETPATQLIYQWNFGDGLTANDQKTPGILRETEHTYSRVNADVDKDNCTQTCPCTPTGRTCTVSCPCKFTATLTVTDTGGKSSADSINIIVGNTNPVANITVSNTQGNSPLTVTFNAKNSTDADKDTLTVEWTWDDGSAVETHPATTGQSPPGDGSVSHPYTLATGQTSATFKPTAKVKDGRGGETTWSGTTITVTAGGSANSKPLALFTISPAQPLLNKEFTVDASQSSTRPPGGVISKYEWDWGDLTPGSTGVTAKHTYTRAGRYTITLTVSDAKTPPNQASTQQTVVISSAAPPPTGTNRAPDASLVADPPEGFVDESFLFDARGSTDPDGDTLSYKFVFGDGEQTAFTASPTATHTYAKVGTYVVRLTVRDAHNASTDLTRSVRVLLQGENRTPIALIATGPRTGAAPLSQTFDGQISYDPDNDTNLTFTWTITLADVVVDTLTGPKVERVFDKVGTYTVVLAVADPAGAVGFSDPVKVIVTEPGVVPEPPPPAPRPTPEPPPPSYLQRPKQVCGFGMLLGFFGSLLALSTMKAVRMRGPRG